MGLRGVGGVDVHLDTRTLLSNTRFQFRLFLVSESCPKKQIQEPAD